MPVYSYQALDPAGSRVRGELSATDKVAALDQIAANGLTPLKLAEFSAAQPWWSRDITLFGPPAFKSEEITQLFRALSSMLATNVPIPTALKFCAELSKDKKMKAKLGAAIASVQDGQSLVDALSQGGPPLPTRLLSQIQIGEVSNTLSSVVSRTSRMLEGEARLSRELKQALVYPVILLGMSVFVFCVLVFYLAPTLAPVFAGADTRAPKIIRAMTALEEGLRENWMIVIFGLGLVVFSGFALRSRMKKWFSKIANHLPFVRSYVSKLESLRFCQTLNLMIGSGAQLSLAVQMAGQTTQSHAWQQMLLKAYDKIIAGETLSAALNDSPLIDQMALTILKTGEESDRMVEVLEPAIQTLETQTAQTLSRAVALMTPILTLLIGLVVGGIILSTISAIMDLNNVAF